ncbi:hypothetical protein LAZ67_2001887 [Cordylochernes scorpioides]|uniref:Uncharacterized protein n=1 Tax=Cordylochernes scorpioides TaxID=51811 RepID=A0ABY6K1L8_9ARAC|nr:hypothetical protein LAZ67_2001887 [Cordylochernes scorpioides]
MVSGGDPHQYRLPSVPGALETVLHLLDLREELTDKGRIAFRYFRIALTKRIAEALVFPVVTYGLCERWTLRKDGGKIIEAFEMWTWKALLKVTCTDKRISICKQRPVYFGPIMRTNGSEKMLGKIKGRRKKGRPAMR